MRVVFLDFDGVVNIPKGDYDKGEIIISCGGMGYGEVNDPVAISFLNALCHKFELEVVVSSSWRVGNTIMKLRELLYESGLAKDIKVQGKTPYDLPPTGNPKGFRGDEVAAYLNDRPQITDYLILDDDSDFLPEQQEHLIKCKSHYGFKLDEFLKAVNLLERKKS